jgi:hypothetical protein
MRAMLFAFLVGCAPTATQMAPDHPANPDAPVGRLAGPPAALRPGVANAPAPEPANGHAGHRQATPTPANEHAGHETPSSTPAPAGEPQPAAEQTTSAPAKAEPKPKPKPPAKKASKPKPPPASKPAPEPKPQPPAPQGHEGHHH